MGRHPGRRLGLVAEMTNRVVLDFETASSCNIKEAGSWGYAQDPTTEIVCCCWSHDGITGQWVAGDPPPERLFALLRAHGGVAHGAAFETAIWRAIAVPKLGWDPLPYPLRCTMAAAAKLALPLGLGDLGAALRLEQEDVKHAALGAMLVKYLNGGCKFDPGSKATGTRLRTIFKVGPAEDLWPGLLPAVLAYCHQDVRATQAVLDAIGVLPDDEEEVYQLDQVINARGVRIDRDGVLAVASVSNALLDRANQRFVEVTSGAVSSITQVGALAGWVSSQLGEPVNSLAKGPLADLLARPDLPEAVREALELRARYGSATAKTTKLLAYSAADGRARGMLQYHGASTGRWAGRGPQPQNMPRPTCDVNADLFSAGMATPDLIDALELIYPSAEEAAKSVLRKMFVPAPGRRFVGGDFSGIESRVLAILAGETWKVKMFQDLDKGIGKDNYLRIADLIFGYECTSKTTHPMERQTGKIAELACGYQGGLGAWRNFDKSDRFTDEQVQGHVQAWRAAHPATVAYWRDLDNAAVLAVLNPGEPVQVQTVSFCASTDRKTLKITLPSGRDLCYWYPQIEEGIYGPYLEVSMVRAGAHSAKKWGRVPFYGGKWTENIVQAVSRDLMVSAMFSAEKAGFWTVLTVHDELLCETAKKIGPKELKSAMLSPPAWAAGWPLNAECWEGTRYGK